MCRLQGRIRPDDVNVIEVTINPILEIRAVALDNFYRRTRRLSTISIALSLTT